MFNTFLLQVPLALAQMRWQGWDAPRFSSWLSSLPSSAFPFGALMGLHFACVAGSVATTSFAHTMSTVNTAPLFFTAFFLARNGMSRALIRAGAPLLPAAAGGAAPGFFHPSRSPLPSALEVSGALVAFSGVCALVSLDGGSSDVPVSLLGDSLGLAASLFMALYLCGGAFRGAATPLFCWMMPLHFSAAAVVGTLALLSGSTLDGGPNGLFGAWAGGGASLGTAGAVAFPSLIAHSLINYLTPTERLGPFLMSMFLNLQPLSGNFFGWMLGIQGTPSYLSLLCGPLIVAGTILATLGKQGRTCTQCTPLCYRCGMKYRTLDNGILRI